MTAGALDLGAAGARRAGRSRQRRWLVAAAGSLLLHLVPVLCLLRVAPTLGAWRAPPEPVVRLELGAALPEGTARAVAAAPVSIERPAARMAKPRTAAEVNPSRAAPAAAPTASPLAAAVGEGAASSGPPASVQAADGGAGAGEGEAAGKVASALRSLLGCAEGSAVQMSEAERAACERRRKAQQGATVGTVDSIPLEKRAYYDAVQQAYQKLHDPRTPVSTEVGGGSFAAPGHPPGLACGFGKKKPPNSLKLGPCFIVPPQGLFTEESAVQRPY